MSLKIMTSMELTEDGTNETIINLVWEVRLILKNLDFLLKNLDFLLKNLDLCIKRS